jgi:Protein of unknown function, DUF481
MKIGAAMNVRTVILSLVLLLPLPLFPRESTDVIVMKNGDRITCEIKALRGGVLSVGPPYILETISVDWSKVARVESKQLFIIKTEDGSVHTGTLNSVETPAGRPMQIEVAETPEKKKVVLDSSRIVSVGETSEKFRQRFTGGVGFGVIYSKGNSSTQYSLSGLAAYPRERWAAQVGFSSTLTSSSGANVSTRNQLTLTGLHLMRWNNYFYGGVGGFLQSAEQGIAGQTLLGGGVGRYFKHTNQTTFSVLGGVAWQNTKYKQSVVPIATQNVASALLDANLDLYRFNKTDLSLNALLLPAVSEPGRVFFNTNASYYIKITGNLSWNISVYGSFDTRPPGNLPSSDYGTSSGLSWTFGSSLRTSPTSVR